MGWSKHFGMPEGLPGTLLLKCMNLSHRPVSHWGMNHIAWREDMHVLDIGCGGGINVRQMLKRCPRGEVTGIDISVTSVKKSQQMNDRELGRRCDILLSSVEQLPFSAKVFDVVTAFETTYFWPDVDRGLRECCRVLKTGGRMMVTCAFSDPENLFNRIVDGDQLTVYPLNKTQQIRYDN